MRLPAMMMIAWAGAAQAAPLQTQPGSMPAPEIAPRAQPAPRATPPRAPSSPTDHRTGAPHAPVAVEANYVLTPGDSIQVTVFQEEELDRTTRIGQNGVIYFPLIGAVQVGDLTVPEAVELIEGLLRKDYLVNPQVTITVLQFATKQITILGQVSRPGVFEIPARQSLDILQAIGMAGGYTRIAHPGRITVKRREGDEEKVYRVDGKKMARSEDEEPFRVMAGDVITVGESIF